MESFDKTQDKQKVTIFTDGSSLGNPGPGGWGATVIFPIWENNGSKLKVESGKLKVTELGGREENTTNNRMELTAAIQALKRIEDFQLSAFNFQLTIYTDSSYVLNGITKWIRDWQKQGWMTKNKEPVLNQDLWQDLLALVNKYEDEQINWRLVKGHVGIVGNERADLIATSFAEKNPVDLFEGTLKAYEEILGESILKIPKEIHVHPKRAHSKAYSYVSLVDGKIETHKIWADCEKRVKGVSGAKYKKAISKEDEEKIIQEWQQKLF